MRTLTRKPKQLTLAVAALAIVAVAAVMLLSGSGSAQATTASLSSVANEDGGAARPLATATPPPHATPEPCPGETGNEYDKAAEVVSTGHIALFDVWWNDDEKELTNTSCPPTVKHVPAGEEDGETIPAQDNRSPSNIDIDQTIIHIDDGHKISLNDDGTTFTDTKYPDLWRAEGLEGPDGGDGWVWYLPACPPEGTPGTDSLCLSFSAALLDPADWTSAGDPVTIDFWLDHVHQIDIDRQDPRYVLTYDVPDADATDVQFANWTTVNLGGSNTPVEPGKYERPMWFFTSPGTYEFQAHIVGYPETARDDNLEISKETSVSSDVRYYTVHVGILADLAVEVDVDSANPNPGEDVTITLTASNAGPDKGKNTKVGVILPEGLNWVEPQPVDNDENTDTETYDVATRTVTWSFGDLLAHDTRTHTIKATVAQGTRGQEQTVTANIYATEDIRSTDVVELDTRLDDNTDSVTVTPLAIPNDPPNVKSWRSVDEHATSGTNVGDPIWLSDGNNVADLDYMLIDDETGSESQHFTHTVVELPDRFPESLRSQGRGVQIQLAENADVTGTEWHELTLKVRDGLDSNGNTDSSIDIETPVAIEIVPDPWEAVTLTVTPDPTHPASEQSVTFTAVLNNIPTDHDTITYRWESRRRLEGQTFSGAWHHHDSNTGNTLMVEPQISKELQVRVYATVNDDYGTARSYGPTQSHVTWGP